MAIGEGGASEAFPTPPPPPRKGVTWTASSQSKSKVSLLPREEFNRSLGAEPPGAVRLLERARGFYSRKQEEH